MSIMPYNNDMIKTLCEEMGIEWNESGQEPTLNHKPFDQDWSIKKIFSVLTSSCEVIEFKAENQAVSFDCSDQYLDAA